MNKKFKHSVHNGLGSCWGVSKAEGHDNKFITIIVRLKRCFINISFCHANLMVPGVEI